MLYEPVSMLVRLIRLALWYKFIKETCYHDLQSLHIHYHINISSLNTKSATNLKRGMILHMVIKKILKSLYLAILVLQHNGQLWALLTHALKQALP
jgi:hypothetical protein